jgi:hypothetical protein
VSPAPGKDPAYEAREAPPWVGVAGLATIAALVILALGLAAAALHVFGRERPLVATLDHRPPAPRLERRGGEDLKRVRAVGRARLTTYGWVDRPAHLARIPIERAMQITARRGWADPEPAP